MNQFKLVLLQVFGLFLVLPVGASTVTGEGPAGLTCSRVFARALIAKNFDEISDHYNYWTTQLKDLLKIEEVKSSSLDKVSENIERMSEENRQDLKRFIRQAYFDVTVNKYVNYDVREVKRILDMAISRLLRPDLAFKKGLAAGKGAWEIYQQYINDARELAGLAPQYEVYDLIKVVNFISGEIRKESSRNYEAQYWRLVIYGSGFNGRGILPRSDIDALADTKEQHKFVQRLNDVYFMKNQPWDHIASNSSDKFTTLNAAEINPILFVVGAETVEMHIYPPISKADISGGKITPALVIPFK